MQEIKEKRVFHLVKWSTTTTNKKERLDMMKWFWRFISEEQALRKDEISEKYGSNSYHFLWG